MIPLLIAIGLTSSLFLIFKAFDKFGISTFQAVVVNYLTCVIVGCLFSLNVPLEPMMEDLSWVVLSCFMGGMFISTFYFMAWSAQNISVSVSTLSSKLSLLVPVLFSVFVLKTEVGSWKYLFGFLLVVLSILLSVYKPESEKRRLDIRKAGVFAFLIFILTGAVDTSINYANHAFSSLESFSKLFPITVFTMAFLFGGLLLFFQIIKGRTKLELKNVMAGIILGIPNYFSIYFLLKALEECNSNGAFVFPIINVSVILLSALMARILFKEKLYMINIIGMIIGVISIAVILI